MPRILLLTATELFTPGGAERVMTLLANRWAERDFQITVMSLGETGSQPFFPLGDKVRVRILGLQGDSGHFLTGVARNFVRVWALRRELKIERPEVIISFLDRTNVLALLASRGLAARVIVCERTDPARRTIGRQWELLRSLTYPWADSLVCQGERPLRYFAANIRRRARVIPNPVMLPEFCVRRRRQSNQKPVLVALGSLRPEKGFDLLLTAFAKLAASYPDWSLVIRGEGPSRAALEAQARSLGIDGRTQFPGVTREPHARLAEADLFVLSSRVEGFPNALCEAMSVGLPVVATDVGAVPEIIRNGVDGVIVPPDDVESLAKELGRLMGSEEERKRLADRAPEVVERFSIERVLGMWDELISQVRAQDNKDANLRSETSRAT